MKSTSSHMSPMIDVTEADPLGDGIMYTRVACANQSDAAARCDQLAVQAAKFGRIRLLIAVSGANGMRSYEERDDLALLLQHASEGWCRWIAVERYDRIARSMGVLVRFLGDLDALGVELRVIDSIDHAQHSAFFRSREFLQIFMTMEEISRKQCLDRMALGRRRAAAPPLGLRRRADRTIEVDPEAWPTVERLFALATDMPSLRSLHRKLVAEGATLSLRRMLRSLANPGYVSGQFVLMCGHTVAVELPRPISSEIFDRAARLLRDRKRGTRQSRPGNA